MRNFSKKLLAVLLCFAMLASVTVMSMTAIADGTSAREALLSAWGNLVYEEFNPIYEGKKTPQGTNTDYITALKVSELPDELTDEQKAMFGNNNTIISKVTGPTIVFNDGDSDLALELLNTKPDITRIVVSVYSTFDQVEFYAYFDGNNYPSEAIWQPIGKGFTVVDFPEITDKIKGWMNDTSSIPEDKSLSYKCDAVYGEGEIYLGAVMYALEKKETVPSAVNNMGNEELIAYIVENVDFDKYVDGVEEFRAALDDLYAEVNPEGAVITEAWGNLKKYNAGENVAYPKKHDVSGANWGDMNAAPQAVGTALDGFGLTKEQIKMFGGMYMALNQKNYFQDVYGPAGQDQTFSEYDKLSYVVYAPERSGTAYITYGHTTGTEHIKDPFVAGEFTEIDVTEEIKGKTMTAIAFELSGDFENDSYVYFGVIRGYNLVNETVPVELYSLSVDELRTAAAELDLSKYAGGVDEFKLAAGLINPNIQALVTAWGNLKKLDAGVAITYLDAYTQSTSDGVLKAAGLTDEQIAKFGGNYLALESGYKDNGSGDFYGRYAYLSEYDKVMYAVYSPTRSGKTYLTFAEDSHRVEILDPFTAGEFTEIDITHLTHNKTADVKDFVGRKLTYMAYELSSKDMDSNSGPVYIGAIMGYNEVSETVPEGLYSLTAKELCDKAEALDLSAYTSGVSEFKTALDKLKATLNPEVSALLTAWENLKKLDAGTTVAYPAKQDMTSITGATPATSVSDGVLKAAGLTDAQIAKFGGVYVTINTAGHYVQDGDPVGKYINFSSYDKVSYVVYSPLRSGTSYINYWWSSANTKVNIKDPFVAGEFTEIDITEDVKGKALNMIAYELVETDTTSNPVYIGAIMGYKLEDAVVPEEVYSMTAEELYDYVAANVNVADYTGDVDAFNTALATLDDVVNATVKVDTENGAITVDNKKAEEGAVVELTTAPEEGYVLKAGTLLAYDKDGNVIGVPTRKGFRESTESDVYEYDTALDGYDTADGITFKGEYVKESELTAPNMGKIGNSVNTEDDVQGMRSVYRMPVTLEADGKYYTSFGGNKQEVTSFGILLCTEKTYNRLGGDITVGKNDQYLKEYDFINNKSIYWYRYDVCDSFEDISVMITGIENAGMQNTLFYSRGYIVAGGVTYYTDATARSYSQYAN